MKRFEIPYIGIDSVDNYSLIYNQLGDYSVIFQINNSVLQYSADSSNYLSFHNLFSNILKVLGAGYTVQKEDILSKRKYSRNSSYDDFLSHKYHENFQSREYTSTQTYLIITKVVKRSAFYKYDPKEFNKFKIDIEKVKDLLKSKNLFVALLDQKSIKRLSKRFLAFSFNEDTFSFSNFNSLADYLEIDNNEVIKSISLVDVDQLDIPSEIRPYKEIDDLGYSFPVDLMNFLTEIPGFNSIVYNQVLSIPNQAGEVAKLRAKRTKHSSIPDPANDLTVNEIDQFLDVLAKQSELLVYSHYNIIIRAKKDEINRIENFIERHLFLNGIIPSKNSYNQLELFRCSLPGNSSELKSYDKFLTTASSALCFFFKERLLEDESSDFNIFFCDRQGIPVAMDPCDLPMETNRINNRNTFVLGPSGSGKSFFMNHLVRQYKLHEMDVVLVDTGHSYYNLCNYFNGKYITYSEEKPITMNPFQISKKEYNEEKRESLKSLIGLLWKGSDGTLNQVEDRIITLCIKSYYETYFQGIIDHLSFNSFYEYSIGLIEEITESEGIKFDLNEYKFILQRFYKGGEFENILNEDVDSSLFEEDLIVFEIDAIKEHKILFPITTIIIMDVFLQKMRNKHNRKALIIEEAWKAIASPMMAGYILYLYKTVRKFFGLATVVTQEIEDIVGNAIVKDSIISNSDTICLLDQSKFKDNYQAVSKLLSLNEVEKRKIFTINQLDNKSGRGRFKEVYIKRGASGEVYGVEVSLYEYLVYTTEKKEKDAIKKYVDCYGNLTIGLEEFVSDFKASGLSLPQFFKKVNQVDFKFSHQKMKIA